MATVEKGITRYSKIIKGTRGNYRWPIQVDVTDGHVRIVQFDNARERRINGIVLLSPGQFKAVKAFAEPGTDGP